jgi:hydrogenase expression/formation protein HypE
MGKLDSKELKKLLSCLKKDPRVIVPPMSGYDSGVHMMGNKYLVVSTDPCVNVPEKWFGWLLVNYAASDVALFGARPEFCVINLLGPLSAKPQVFQAIMEQACNSADELSMAIVTGHTGTYDGLSRIVGVCTAYGTVAKEKLITPGGAQIGDYILCTKPVGLETIVNFVLTQKALAQKLYGIKHVERLGSLVRLQSCVQEGLLLAKTSAVHAMHDATEGGLVAALNEMAEASKVGFVVDFDKIPLSIEMEKLRETFGLTDSQVLSASSTGTIIAAVDPNAIGIVETALRKIGLSPSFVGSFTKDKERILKKEKEEWFPRVADDPYYKIIDKKAHLETQSN